MSSPRDSAVAAQAPPRRVDAHQHFWQRARGDYDWLRDDVPALAPLRHDFLPADLAPALARHDIDRTVLVQAAATVAETEFLLALADRHDVVGAVVGWVDLADPRSADTLERLAAHPAFKGVRPMLQDLPDPRWIATAPHPRCVDALVALGLRLDTLVRTPQLAALRDFAADRPALPVVIDHAAKPPLHHAWDDAPLVEWRARMAGLAALPQVCCKVSGLVTELPSGAATSPAAIATALRPTWHALLEWFGPTRLMWGSDWPVLGLASSYDDWVEAGDLLLADLSDSERADVLRGTACHFYGFHGFHGLA